MKLSEGEWIGFRRGYLRLKLSAFICHEDGPPSPTL
jgi:hypothetical protein